MKKTTTPSVRLKKKQTKRQQIKDYEAATPEATQPSKNNLFWKRQHNTLADSLFFSPEENENYYQKMPTV